MRSRLSSFWTLISGQFPLAAFLLATAAMVDSGFAASNAPANLQLEAPASVVEGQEFFVRGTFADADPDDTHVVRIFWEGGVAAEIHLPAGTTNFAASYTYYFDSFLPIYAWATVEDAAGATADQTFPITVLNAPPLIQSVVLSTDACTEGDQARVSVQFSDAGIYDFHRVEIDWGDSIDLINPQGRSFVRDHIFFDNTIYGSQEPIRQIAVTIWDEHDFAIARTNLTVLNAPPGVPQISLTTNSIFESQSVTLSASFTDRGRYDSHTALVDWGDGSPVELVEYLWSRDFSLTHVYRDNPRAGREHYNITVVVSDDEGERSTNATSVVVKNTPPGISGLTIASRIPAHSLAILRGEVTDASPQDNLVLEIDWGDGRPAQIVNITPGAASFAVPHTFDAGGPRCEIRVQARDDDGASVSAKAQVEMVSPADLPACPPVLRTVQRGPAKYVEWETPGIVLQSAPAIEGPWTDIEPQPQSPLLLPGNEPMRFFRVRP
jgi:hypothetical protein